MIEIEKDLIDVRHHVKVRYCERIIGLDAVVGKEELERINAIVNPKARDTELKSKINGYITLNDERIINDIRTAFIYSDFVYRGSFGGDNTTKDFYVRDDIVFVSETQRPRLITLYKVDFGFKEKNRELVQWVKDSIEKLRDRAENIKSQVEDFVLEKKIQNLEYDDQIKNAEATLEALRKLKKANQETIDAEQAKLVIANKELEQSVFMLCNNPAFKRDILEGDGGK
jgi:hypothetical protein